MEMINFVLILILCILVTALVLIFFAWIFNIIIYTRENKKNVFSPRFYVKEIPFLFNHKQMYRVRTAGQFLGIVLLTAASAFLFLSNMTPFGVTVQYAMEQDTRSISQLGPKDRVKQETRDGQTVFVQTADLVYFTTQMPFKFDMATVRVFFKNAEPEQTLSVGYRDQEDWHYAFKPYDVPLLNGLDWIKNGYDPVLYQREQQYISVDAFMENPPVDGIIGTYEYSSGFGNIEATRIADYEPRPKETVIKNALRGSHTMYVYLDNEPFRMDIVKQDLNWYEGLDEMTVKIYKGDVLVFEAVADDDGVVDNSKKILSPQTLELKNPSEELPESGVYKIVVQSNGDSVIKQIRTNLHKIVFANTIFPVANSSVYPGIVATTSATTVYTNALTLSATTYHEQGKQDILVGDQILDVHTVKLSSFLPPKDDIAKVVIPQNDVVLNGFMGYFAFERDQFFLPTKYHVMPITKAEDVSLVDYILTDYRPSRTEGEWQVNEQMFDLKTAYIKDGKLSWIIKAPKLKERGGEIIIKDIQITFHKKGWL